MYLLKASIDVLRKEVEPKIERLKSSIDGVKTCIDRREAALKSIEARVHSSEPFTVGADRIRSLHVVEVSSSKFGLELCPDELEIPLGDGHRVLQGCVFVGGRSLDSGQTVVAQ